MTVFLFPTSTPTASNELTAGSIIDKVRIILQDTDTSELRDDDSEFIGWINDAINTVLSLMPELFSKFGDHVCTAGVNQTVVLPRAVQLLDVVGVPICDQATLTQFAPGWQNATPGAAKNYMRSPGDKLGFRVYPPAAANAVIPIEYVESPAPLTTRADKVPLPESFEPALVEYVAGFAQMKEDESINFQRQQALMSSFVARITGQQAATPKPE